jgi:hypothetical protein
MADHFPSHIELLFTHDSSLNDSQQGKTTEDVVELMQTDAQVEAFSDGGQTLPHAYSRQNL